MGADNDNRAGVGESGPMLALAPGLRETGWAVLDGARVADSGIAGLKGRHRMEPSERITQQLETLSAVAGRWRTVCAVRIKADSANWRVPGQEQLDEALYAWAEGLGIPLLDYVTREVRAAVAGQPNARPGRRGLRHHAPPGSHRPEPGHGPNGRPSPWGITTGR